MSGDWILNWQVKEPGIYDVADSGPQYEPKTWWSGVVVFKRHFNHGNFLAIEYCGKKELEIKQINNLHGWLFRKKQS